MRTERLYSLEQSPMGTNSGCELGALSHHLVTRPAAGASVSLLMRNTGAGKSGLWT